MTTAERTFVGFGFGAIQAGLFLYEAQRSGRFRRLVVAEVLPEVVAALRRADGRYGLNVATPTGIRQEEVTGLEIYDPRDAAGRHALTAAVAEASDIATALPSVDFYGSGSEADVVRILAGGLEAKARRAGAPYTVIYTAENHNRAAEILADGLRPHLSAAARGRFECLNTVIGKMSGVVTGRAEIEAQGLVPIAPGLPRAFLVETFNRILISGIRRRDFQRGITVFEEQPDLRPFEEAKLYGHNAVHALLGFLLRARGRRLMAEAADEPDLLTLAREAFTEESGGALCRKFTGVAPLFTRSGYAAYADDLLRRMLNPHLRDSVARVTRDPRRKLGWHDRLIGTMRVALSQGIRPVRFARGAAAALRTLAEEARSDADRLLATLWEDEDANPVEKAQITELVAATGVRT